MSKSSRMTVFALLLGCAPLSGCDTEPGPEEKYGAITLDGDVFNYEIRQHLGGPITSTVTLLQYTYWSGAPPFCRTPTALLNYLDDILDSSECIAEFVGVDARANVSLTCLAPVTTGKDGIDNCQIEYTGRLWAVRTRSSETNYMLFGQGSLARICVTSDGRERTLPAQPSDAFAQHRASKNLERHLEPCAN